MAAEHSAPTLLLVEGAALLPRDSGRMLECVDGVQAPVTEPPET